jgi:hypothetical protein
MSCTLTTQMLETEPCARAPGYQQSVQLRSVCSAARHGTGLLDLSGLGPLARSPMSPCHQLDRRGRNPSRRRTYEYGEELPAFVSSLVHRGQGWEAGATTAARAAAPADRGLRGKRRRRGARLLDAKCNRRPGQAGRALQGKPASAAGRVAVGWVHSSHRAPGWVGAEVRRGSYQTVWAWLESGARKNIRGAPLRALSHSPLSRLVSVDHRIREPPWLAAFRSREVKRNHRARAFSCNHVFWIRAEVTCMIKPCGFRFFFLKVFSRSNWPGVTIDRQTTVDATYDGPMARAQLIMGSCRATARCRLGWGGKDIVHCRLGGVAHSPSLR